jgi:single-stranded DNA-binding protein
MQQGWNEVTLIGRLNKDPRLKVWQPTEGSQRKPITTCEFVVGTYEVVILRGWKRTIREYIPCVAFSRDAENIAAFFRKGNRILVKGRLRTKMKGKKKSGWYRRVEVEVLAWQFSDTREEHERICGFRIESAKEKAEREAREAIENLKDDATLKKEAEEAAADELAARADGNPEESAEPEPALDPAIEDAEPVRPRAVGPMRSGDAVEDRPMREDDIPEIDRLPAGAGDFAEIEGQGTGYPPSEPEEDGPEEPGAMDRLVGEEPKAASEPG